MRKTNLLGLLAAIALFASPAMIAPAFAVDNTISNLCRADHAGSSYQRPGGFCDQVASNKSLVDPVGGGCSWKAPHDSPKYCNYVPA